MSAPTATGTPSLQLRLTTFAAGLGGISTLVVSGVISPVVGALSVLLVAGATAVTMATPSPAAQATRRRLAVVMLAGSAVVAVATSRGGLSDSTGAVLGLLLCTALVVHSLVLDTVRDQRVDVTVAISMLLLAAGLAPGLSIAVPVLVTWACAVAVFVVSSAENQGADAPVVATTSTARPPLSWATVVSAVAVALLAGLALALVLPRPPGLSAQSAFGPGSLGTGGSPGGGHRSASAYLGNGPLSLDARGSLDPTPIAVVTAGSSLWRASVLDAYDGHTWSPTTSRGVEILGDGTRTRVAIPRDDLSPPQPGDDTRRDGVGWLGVAAPVVISPGLPTAIDLRDRSHLIRGPDGRVEPDSLTATPSYVIESEVVPSVDGIVGAEVGRDADEAIWRTLPTTIPGRVGLLARQITAGATSRADAVRSVETYLRTHMQYDLNSPVAPQDADTVDDLLFNSKTGFCEHFAAAEVVLLRSVGIPSRFVSGFAAGPPSSDGNVVLRNSDAHAWVEVWIEGHGWASSDPTDGIPLVTHSSEGPTATARRAITTITSGTSGKLGVAVALIVLALAAALLPGLRRGRRRGTSSTPAPSGPLFAAFGRLEAALERVGRPRGSAESIRALAARLDATDDVVGALLAVERASYASRPPGRDEERSAVDTIDRVTARLLADREDAPASR